MYGTWLQFEEEDMQTMIAPGDHVEFPIDQLNVHVRFQVFQKIKGGGWILEQTRLDCIFAFPRGKKAKHSCDPASSGVSGHLGHISHSLKLRERLSSAAFPSSLSELILSLVDTQHEPNRST